MKNEKIGSAQRLNVDALMKKGVIGVLLGCLVTTIIIFCADGKNLSQSMSQVDKLTFPIQHRQLWANG